jgi:hypothetical protein
LNRPPVNGFKLLAGVYLGDEHGLHSVQLLAWLVALKAVSGKPFGGERRDFRVGGGSLSEINGVHSEQAFHRPPSLPDEACLLSTLL